MLLWESAKSWAFIGLTEKFSLSQGKKLERESLFLALGIVYLQNFDQVIYGGRLYPDCW